jgi:hypothetical protein
MHRQPESGVMSDVDEVLIRVLLQSQDGTLRALGDNLRPSDFSGSIPSVGTVLQQGGSPESPHSFLSVADNGPDTIEVVDRKMRRAVVDGSRGITFVVLICERR